MLRLRTAGVALVGLACSVSSVQADWHSFWAGVERGRQRNNAWPEPFATADKEAAVAPINLMIVKGWQRQNLLGEHHFEADKSALSQAGQLKLRWILTQVPPEHRIVYVERGLTEEATAARIDIVQQATTTMVAKGDLPQVVASNMISRGWPAAQVDSVGRKYTETTPSPRLPTFSPTTGGSN